MLFLDEPTIGLDAPSKLAVREFVGRLNRERGVTVLLTTHDMHDIEALAERVIVIGGGRILADGTFEALRATCWPSGGCSSISPRRPGPRHARRHDPRQGRPVPGATVQTTISITAVSASSAKLTSTVKSPAGIQR